MLGMVFSSFNIMLEWFWVEGGHLFSQIVPVAWENEGGEEGKEVLIK